MQRSSFLITGGAGFLGINLCRYLLSRGHSVRSLDIAPFEYPERNAVDVRQGDIREAGVVQSALAGIDIVVHCAAALPLSREHDIMSTDVAGTSILLETAFGSGVARFIFISSTAVYGIPDHHPLHENDAVIGVGPYGTAKIAAERLCLRYRAEGRCVPILRPKSFVGPERLGVFELLYDWAYDGRNFPVLGSGDNLYQLLDVDDLCTAIDLCATADSATSNDTFNVGATDFCTMRENFQAILDRAGHGKHVISLPAGPAIAVLKLLELAKLSPLYRWIYETAAEESFVSTALIESRLAFSPKYSNRDALIRNYDWYCANRDGLRDQSGVSHRVPWRKGALRLAKYFF